MNIHRGIGVPENTLLPLFVYGMFKYNEILFYKIHEFVDKNNMEAAYIYGQFYLKNGVPIIKITSNKKKVTKCGGHLVTLESNEDIKTVYNIVGEIFSDKTYIWQKIKVYFKNNLKEPVEANMLVARDMKSLSYSEILKEEEWNSTDDPWLIDAMEYLRKKYFDKWTRKINVARKIDDLSINGMDSIFELHMAYNFLWKIIDRYCNISSNIQPCNEKNMYEHLYKQKEFIEATNIIKPYCFTEGHYKAFSSSLNKRRFFKPLSNNKDLEYQYRLMYYLAVSELNIHKQKKNTYDTELLLFSFVELFAIMDYVIKKTVLKVGDADKSINIIKYYDIVF